MKKAAIIYASTHHGSTKKLVDAISDKYDIIQIIILGQYGCKGYNTYGPWKLIGGMNKKHPNKEDLDGAIDFFGSILN